MKIGLISLGCSKNRVDAEVMLGELVKNGHQLTNDEKEAEVLIVNTCGFIDSAKRESIDTILEMADYKEGNCKYLIVSGCLSQRYIEELPKEFPEVDAFIGVGDYHNICEVIDNITGDDKDINPQRQFVRASKSMPYSGRDRVVTTPKHLAYLKISEGCNNRCSYCAIPMIKGNYKSGEFDKLIEEAKGLVSGGAKEIVLIAQDTTRYGMDFGELLLPKLIDELCKIEGLVWLRILYAYPECVSDEIIDAMVRNPKVCKYLDVPIQHISDNVLKTMNRTSNKKDVIALIDKLKSLDFTIRSTFIVGFPGETEEDFKELMDFTKEAKIDRLGVFMYSQEENTKAATMEQLDEDIKKRRHEEIMTLAKDVSKDIMEKRIGKTYQVLIESIEDGIYVGRSVCEAPEIDGKIYVSGFELKFGEFYDVTITQSSDYDVYGVVKE